MVGINDYHKVTISRIEQMKTEITTLTNESGIKEWLNNEAAKLLSLIEDYYDTKALMSDLIKFNNSYKALLTQLVVLL